MTTLTRSLMLLTVVLACGRISQAGTIVRFDTVLGNFDVELFDTIAPNYTANFLAYVNAGDYDNSLVHRKATTANSGVNVIQGGRYRFDGTSQVEPQNYPEITSRGPVSNEPSLSNLAGTLSLARPGGLPDFASREWFINVTDNTVLDNPINEEPFTVFGNVIAGMDVVVAIHSLETFSFQSPWNQGPMRNYTVDDFNNFVPVDGDNVMLINSISVILEADTDMDGDVDEDDLSTMLQNFTGDGGMGKGVMDGDTDMDGDVDTADITTGLQNYTGATGLQNFTGATALSVPEPSGWLLLVLGLCGLLAPSARRFCPKIRQ